MIEAKLPMTENNADKLGGVSTLLLLSLLFSSLMHAA